MRVLGLIVAAAAALTISSTAAANPLYLNAGIFYSAEANFVGPSAAGSPCPTQQSTVRLFSSAGQVAPGSAATGDPQSAFLDLWIYTFDPASDCTQVGSVAYGFVTVDRSAFTFTGDGTDTARVSAPVTVCDRNEEFLCTVGTTRTVLADVTFVGAGETFPFRGTPNMNLQPGVALQLSKASVEFRFANATGTIMDGTTNLAPALSIDARLLRFTLIDFAVVTRAPPADH